MRNPLSVLARIPGIAWVGVLVLVFGSAAGSGILASWRRDRALTVAHKATTAAAADVAAAHVIFVHDTIRLPAARATYRTLRDSAIAHPGDSARASHAFAAGDAALELDSTAVASAARTIDAYRVLVGAQQGEIAIALSQRERHFAVHALGGMDLTDNVPVAELDATMRITDRWAIVARASQRFTIGESPRRLLLLRYTF